MANKEKIDYLLLDIRELEKLVAGIRDAEIYPASFFSQAFEQTHKILKSFHKLESNQIESLRKQMEEHEALIHSIIQVPAPSTEIPEEQIAEPVKKLPEIKETPKEIIESLIVPDKQENIISQEKGPDISEEAGLSLESQMQEEVVPFSATEEQIKKNETKSVSEKINISLNEIIEKRQLSDFKKAFSLNDRFRFRRELFGGDESKMNQTISALNEIHTYEDSVAYLDKELKWNIEDEAVADFIKLLEKRFL